MRRLGWTAGLLSVMLGTVSVGWSEEAPQVQRRSEVQETYQPSANAPATTPGAAVQGPAAGVQTPVGGAHVQTGAVQAQGQPSTAPANTAMTPTQRTVTTQETVMAQTNPPIRWSRLQGEVTHVDKVNNVVEIRLKGSKDHIGIPVVERKVGIYRHGDHQYALKDLEPGDDITLRNLNTSL